MKNGLSENADFAQTWFLAQLAAWDKSSADICGPVRAAAASLLMKKPGEMFDLEAAHAAFVLKLHRMRNKTAK